MKYELISLDMQGTITDSQFSDTFWLETLPLLYTKRFSVSVEVAKQTLSSLFKSYGPYDSRYYDWKYWIRLWNLPYDFNDIVRFIGIRPVIYPSAIRFIEKAHSRRIPLIITSSTTHDFITEELGTSIDLFQNRFSSLDDFGIAGKPPELYRTIEKRCRVDALNIIHIGDSKTMDVDNAIAAGWNAIHVGDDIEALFQSLLNDL